MILKVKGDKTPKPIVELSLVENLDGSVDLIGELREIDWYFLLNIKRNGTVKRYEGVAESLGFKVDLEGRIIIE